MGFGMNGEPNSISLDVLTFQSNDWRMNLNQANNVHVRKNRSRVAVRRSLHLFVCAMRNIDRAM